MDFDDMLTLAYEYLSTDGKLLERCAGHYRYINVDEAQDTSKIQHEIIGMLAARSRQLFMVGDEDQSIYGFLGAFPKRCCAFPRTIQTGRSSRWSAISAHRCHHPDASALISHNQDRYDKQMHGVRGGGCRWSISLSGICRSSTGM